jgi:hypothetical protein
MSRNIWPHFINYVWANKTSLSLPLICTSVCTKPGVSAVIYMCVKGINFATFSTIFKILELFRQCGMIKEINIRCIIMLYFIGDTCNEHISQCITSPCTDGSICTDLGDDQFSCICMEGYTGHNCSVNNVFLTSCLVILGNYV